MKYLLAAEADRIQDLLFRSSKLREVAGGSLLLSRFCIDVPKLLQDQLDIGDKKMTVITHGGGSFYIAFDHRDDAVRFGAALAEAYARVIGGTLSYAEPADLASDDAYGKASDEAGKNLRQAKRSGAAVATEQMPYVAFCESCGVGLAGEYKTRFEGEDAHYYCHACLAKAAEYSNKSGFLLAFNRDVVVDEATFQEPNWQEVDEESCKKWDTVIVDEKRELFSVPEDIAIYDPRRYVAYIVADGNGMGKVFHQCNAKQAHALSEYMDTALRRSLAKAMRDFRDNEVYKHSDDPHIPAMPLIMGGDDLFALVPAPFALDIARRMCVGFQNAMTTFACEQGIKNKDGNALAITMSAVVVICKANYPYNLAHDLGEERLRETKRAVKALAAQGHMLSAVDFEVVLGSQLGREKEESQYRATLRPYWVPDNKFPDSLHEDSDVAAISEPRPCYPCNYAHQQSLPEGWGLSLQTLLDARRHLAQAHASRRRSQLRALFDDLSDEETWNRDIKELLARIEPDWEKAKQVAKPKDRLKLFPLTTTLEDLGGIEMSTWLEINRLFDGKTWQGHGMGDLLRFWDWTLDLDHDPAEYEGGVS